MSQNSPEAGIHRPLKVAEVRPLSPTADGWTRREPTGRAVVVCPCGLDTGFIDDRDATDQLNNHVANAMAGT